MPLSKAVTCNYKYLVCATSIKLCCSMRFPFGIYRPCFDTVCCTMLVNLLSLQSLRFHNQKLDKGMVVLRIGNVTVLKIMPKYHDKGL